MKYLASTALADKLDIKAKMLRVMGVGGPGPYRQLLQAYWLRFGGAGIGLSEYYAQGFWRKDMDPEYRKYYLPAKKYADYNNALKIPVDGPSDDVTLDKLASEALFRSNGIACAETRAVFGEAPQGTAAVELGDQKDIEAYLSDPAHMPLFSKPRKDSLARAAVAIASVSEDKSAIMFTNGIEAPITDLAAEIVEDWSDGYLFQRLYSPHRTLLPHTGKAMTTFRIATLRTAQGIEPFYGVYRLPSATAMHDGGSRNRRAWATIDVETCKVIRLRPYARPEEPDLTHWLDPTTPFLGVTLPFGHEAIDLVRKAHDLFPANGILGWDVFLTDDGPLIGEVNAQPMHFIQASAGVGLYHPSMHRIYERALAYAKANGANPKA